MAETSSQVKVVSALSGFGNLSIMRQVLLMMGLAASIGLGVVIVMWSQQPNYVMLYGGLSDQDSLDVTNALDRSGIPYRITAGSGAILVPGDRVHEARINLAGQGLPKETVSGFDLLDKDQGVAMSQFMENARYQRALEGELAKSISSMSNVQSARVHLAIPRQSETARDRKEPSASVMLTVYGGRPMRDEQVAAIVHLVASSVSNLSPDKVTVVDQTGKLLASQESSDSLRLTASQFDYRKKVEDYYAQRIEEILSPILGSNGVRAQVSADIDFTQTEQTQENYNPDLPAVRSEKTYEDHTSGSSGASGVPGVLSNQPSVTQNQAKRRARGGGDKNGQEQNGVRRVTRNYELDKPISHTNFQTGLIRKLSIAVVVDDHQEVNDDGSIARTPLKETELARLTSLVKEAVGFNAERGDSVNVINASFAQPPALEPPPPTPFYQKPWVWDAAKQVAAGIGVLLLVFGVFRPLMRSLVEKAPPPGAAVVSGGGGSELPASPGMGMSGQSSQGQWPRPNNYEQQLGAIKGMASQDPKRVAQVVKNWVSTDD
jgi:flagellar M-ring protein FliF